MTKHSDFAAYNEYVATLHSAPRAALSRAVNNAIAAGSPVVTEIKPEDACSKCKGSGRFISYAGRDVGPCFSCNGTGRAQGADSALAKIAMEKELFAEQPIDLSKLPSGTYAVPNGETRLKVRVKRPGQHSNWHGFIFVDDGAAYGQGQRYGKQAPGRMYEGKIKEQLRAILANPYEAATAYGKLTGTCCVCGRHLEDEVSVREGIGPICAGRFKGESSEG